MLFCRKQLLAVMLSMDIDEHAGDVFEHGYRSRLSVDLALGLAVLMEGAHDEQTVARFDLISQICQCTQNPGRDIVKDSCDRSRIFPGPNNIPGGTLSQNRVDGIDQNGFACAGLAGKDIEPLGKVDIRFLDNCNILDVKLGKHSDRPFTSG